MGSRETIGARHLIRHLGDDRETMRRAKHKITKAGGKVTLNSTGSRSSDDPPAVRSLIPKRRDGLH